MPPTRAPDVDEVVVPDYVIIHRIDPTTGGRVKVGRFDLDDGQVPPEVERALVNNYGGGEFKLDYRRRGRAGSVTLENATYGEAMVGFGAAAPVMPVAAPAPSTTLDVNALLMQQMATQSNMLTAMMQSVASRGGGDGELLKILLPLLTQRTPAAELAEILSLSGANNGGGGEASDDSVTGLLRAIVERLPELADKLGPVAHPPATPATSPQPAALPAPMPAQATGTAAFELGEYDVSEPDVAEQVTLAVECVRRSAHALERDPYVYAALFADLVSHMDTDGVPLDQPVFVTEWIIGEAPFLEEQRDFVHLIAVEIASMYGRDASDATDSTDSRTAPVHGDTPHPSGDGGDAPSNAGGNDGAD